MDDVIHAAGNRESLNKRQLCSEREPPLLDFQRNSGVRAIRLLTQISNHWSGRPLLSNFTTVMIM